MKVSVLMFILFAVAVPTAQAAEKFTSIWQKPRATFKKGAFPLTASPAPTIATCKKGSTTCTIQVTVAEDCTVTVEPAILIVEAQGVDIEWTLTAYSSDVVFHASRPIVYVGGTPRDFKPKSLGLRKQVHTDANSVEGRYQYDVWVQRPSGHGVPDACGTDPVIYNRG